MRLSCLLIALVSALITHADVKPHGLICENAVLQQQMPVPIWGTAADGEKVTVEFQDQNVSTTAANGQWNVTLKPLKAGGPFTMKISGANAITYTNILVGEVWVISGQSNAAMGLGDCLGAEEHKKKADDSQLRLFQFPWKSSHTVDIHPKDKEPVGVRLAIAARGIAYREKIVYSGPIYQSMKIDRDRVMLSFKHVGGGLVAKDGR